MILSAIVDLLDKAGRFFMSHVKMVEELGLLEFLKKRIANARTKNPKLPDWIMDIPINIKVLENIVQELEK